MTNLEIFSTSLDTQSMGILLREVKDFVSDKKVVSTESITTSQTLVMCVFYEEEDKDQLPMKPQSFINSYEHFDSKFNIAHNLDTMEDRRIRWDTAADRINKFISTHGWDIDQQTDVEISKKLLARYHEGNRDTMLLLKMEEVVRND